MSVRRSPTTQQLPLNMQQAPEPQLLLVQLWMEIVEVELQQNAAKLTKRIPRVANRGALDDTRLLLQQYLPTTLTVSNITSLNG